MAQVDASGTAATAEMVKTSFCPKNGFLRLKLPNVKTGSAGFPENRSGPLLVN